MVNPWGGVEAMLTHALSSTYNIPTAHSPMFESREIANMDPGIVDPRMAAEAVSSDFPTMYTQKAYSEALVLSLIRRR